MMQAAFRAVLPKARRLWAQRRAARFGVTKAPTSSAQILQQTIGKLTGRASEPTWWRNAIAKIPRVAISPNTMFLGTSLHAWLDDPATLEHLETLLVQERSGLSNIGRTVDPARAALRESYERLVGDRGILADAHVALILAVALAGLDADLMADPGAAAAVVQSRAIGSVISRQVATVEKAVGGIQEDLGRLVTANSLPDALVLMIDQACTTELDRICKLRVVPGFDATSGIAGLAADVGSGGRFASCSVKTRADVLSWAARLHAVAQPSLATSYRSQLLGVAPAADTLIVDTWLAHMGGDDDTAVRLLRDRDDPDTRAAMLSILRRSQGTARALAWLDGQEPVSPPLLTAVGWYNAVALAAEAGRWSDATRWLEPLGEEAHIACPDLLFLGGVVNAALIFPSDIRRHVLTMSVEVTSMLQSGAEADAQRATALTLFARAAVALRTAGAEVRALGADRWIVWLRLTDPVTRKEAEAQVAVAMADGRTAVEMIDLACACAVPFDEGPLVTHLRVRELSGRLDGADLVAKLRLYQHRRPAADLATFLTNERVALQAVVTQGGYAALLVTALANAGRLDDAEAAWGAFQGDLGTDGDRLGDMLRSARGEDVLPSLEERYTRTGALLDLLPLIDCIGGRDPDKAAQYGLTLFGLQRTPANAGRVAFALLTRHRHADALEFLDRCPDLVQANVDLLALRAQALYGLARFKDVKPIVARLVAERDDANDVALEVNVAVAIGDWEHLAAVLDREFPKRDARTADHLLRLASVCAEANPARAVEIVSVAARKEPSNPAILAAAGMLAVQLGYDDVGFPLVSASARLSSEAGPVREIGLEKVAFAVGDSLERSRAVSMALSRAEIPLAAACLGLNTSVTQLLVNQARRNGQIADWRGRTIIPFRHGGRPLVDVSGVRSIAADFTALIVAADLGLLPRFQVWFEHVFVPWSTAEQLMTDARQARFHQPSQVRAAKQLRALLTSVPPQAGIESAATNAPRALRDEVGNEIASLLAAALVTGGRVVVISAGALPCGVRQRLRGTAWEALLATPKDVVHAMRLQGVADGAMLDRAERFVERAEPGMRDPIPLPVAPLYLDQLAAGFLLTAGLLESLHSLGRKVLVSGAAAAQAFALEQTDEELSVSMNAIDAVRTWYREGLEQGRVSVMPLDAKPALPAVVPTLMQLVQMQRVVDAVMIEDRALGRATVWPGGPGMAVPLFGIVDLLASLAAQGAMPPEERWRQHHILRRRTYSGVPLLPDELEHWIAASATEPETGSFMPCAELRTLRDYLLRLRSATFLLQPAESAWLDGVSISGLIAIRRCWSAESIATEQARARATWLYEGVVQRPQDWRQGIEEGSVLPPATELLATQIGMLLPPTHVDAARTQALAEWLEQSVLAELVPGSLSVLDKVADRARDLVRRWRDGAPADHARAMAERVIAAQPPSIQSRLSADAAFLAECGIEVESWIQFGGGPSVVRSDLVRAAEACGRTGECQTMAGEDGLPVFLSRGPEGLELATTDETAIKGFRPDFLQLLSTDARVRVAAANTVIAAAGPTGPTQAFWLGIINERPPDAKEFSHFLHEVQSALASRLHRGIAGLTSGQLNMDELFPTELSYYEALCSPCTRGDADVYFRTTFPAHLGATLGIDTAAGLEMWLVSCLRDDLAQADIWPGTVDELWERLDASSLRADPFSMLSALAFCVRHIDDQRFEDLADSLVRQLCLPKIDRGDGLDQLAYFPALVNAADSAVRRTPGMSALPVWWRDLCAWVQAGMTARAFLSVSFDPGEMSAALQARRDRTAYLESFFDLRESPKRRLGDVDATSIRAEILGRLQLLKDRVERKGKTFPAADALAQFERDAKLEGFWPLRSQPGPLEGHQRPTVPLRSLPRGLRRRLGRALSIRRGASFRPFLHLVAALAGQIQLGNAVGQRCADLIQAAPVEEGSDQLASDLGYLAWAAVRQGWPPLADVLLNRCVVSFETQTTGTQAVGLARVVLLATQALPLPYAMQRHGEVIAAAAARLGPDALAVLRSELVALRRVISVELWCLGFADALAAG